MLRLRRELGVGAGHLTWEDGVAEDVLAFRVDAPGGTLRVLANLGPHPVPLTGPGTVVLASGELGPGGAVPADVTVWRVAS
jgi:hypothetical protein